jgi:AhpD family alkylhydroperoxidase
MAEDRDRALGYHDAGGAVENAKRVRDELREPSRGLRDEIPEVLAAYGELAKAAFADGALSAKHKELAALAIAISKECDGCIVAHANNLTRIGASRAEVAEIIGVAIAMNGGPGTVWGPRALAAFDELLAMRLASSADHQNS